MHRSKPESNLKDAYQHIYLDQLAYVYSMCYLTVWLLTNLRFLFWFVETKIIQHTHSEMDIINSKSLDVCACWVWSWAPRKVENYLLVLLREVFMVAMIMCTYKRKAHSLCGSSTCSKEEKRVRNSIGGLHFTRPIPLNPTWKCPQLVVLISSAL